MKYAIYQCGEYTGAAFKNRQDALLFIENNKGQGFYYKTESVRLTSAEEWNGMLLLQGLAVRELSASLLTNEPRTAFGEK